MESTGELATAGAAAGTACCCCVGLRGSARLLLAILLAHPVDAHVVALDAAVALAVDCIPGPVPLKVHGAVAVVEAGACHADGADLAGLVNNRGGGRQWERAAAADNGSIEWILRRERENG